MAMVSTPGTKRTTLYRMLEGTTFDTALTESRRTSDGSFTVTDLDVEGQPARLVAGSITSPTRWANDLKLLTGQTLSLSNRSPGAALLIEDDAGTIWAVTWGTGFHFLDSEQIDYGFGASIVARSAVSDEVKSVTKTVLDHRARVDRSSTPNGSTVRDLGVDGYGEVVSRIEAKALISDLTAGHSILHLRAADSLNLPLARTGTGLLSDLAILSDLAAKPVLPGMESLEQLVALKPQDSRVAALDEKLVDALLSSAPKRLGIAWPHERLDAYAPVMSVKVTGLGDRLERVSDETPDITDVTSWLTGIPRKEVLTRLKTVKIELHSTAEPGKNTLAANTVALRRWLTFEVEDGNKRFCLHDGSWYRMDDDYLSRIDDRVRDILTVPVPVSLPTWGQEHEDEYNKRASSSLSGLCLDRKLISTPLHSRGGIEPCDVFVAPGTLIHVKRGRSSADLSHLLAQGLVSADALARDENAREAWRTRVIMESQGLIKDAKIIEVVLAIGSTNTLTVDSLFTFTKVNLVKQFDALRYLGVRVSLTAIETTPEPS